MTENSVFSRFMAISWVIAHSFGVKFGFVWPVKPDTCLRIMTKNSVFSCFMVVFMSYCPRFWGSKTICIPRKMWYMLESYDKKTRHFHVLWPFSWAIAHSFAVRGQYLWSVRHDTCLRVMTKNSSFSRFIAAFMSYCPRFWSSRSICMAHKTWYMFEWHGQKIIVFVLCGCFHELLQTVLVLNWDLHGQ